MASFGDDYPVNTRGRHKYHRPRHLQCRRGQLAVVEERDELREPLFVSEISSAMLHGSMVHELQKLVTCNQLAAKNHHRLSGFLGDLSGRGLRFACFGH